MGSLDQRFESCVSCWVSVLSCDDAAVPRKTDRQRLVSDFSIERNKCCWSSCSAVHVVSVCALARIVPDLCYAGVFVILDT
jgi:hypothetical protein